MIVYVLSALMFGAMVPYMARRFAKFMPATFAATVVEMFRPGKKIKAYYRLEKYKNLLKWSMLLSVVVAGLTAVAYRHFGENGFGWIVFFIWILILAAEIDWRTFLLPDILTVPLLIAGFAAAVSGNGFVVAEESAWGAVVGYVLPVMVSLLIVWRKKDAFGGGDVKLLAALGAWLGVEGLLYVIVAASVAGMVYALVCRKKMLAFGPMLAWAGIGVAFWLF